VAGRTKARTRAHALRRDTALTWSQAIRDWLESEHIQSYQIKPRIC